jgi:hypothetical protein
MRKRWVVSIHLLLHLRYFLEAMIDEIKKVLLSFRRKTRKGLFFKHFRVESERDLLHGQGLRVSGFRKKLKEVMLPKAVCTAFPLRI